MVYKNRGIELYNEQYNVGLAITAGSAAYCLGAQALTDS